MQHRVLRPFLHAVLACQGLLACQGDIAAGGSRGEADRGLSPTGATGGRAAGPGGADTPIAGAAGGAAPVPGLSGSFDPGRVVLRRLNRVEYDNTVRDLLGTPLRPAERLPGDEVDHGFDTLGSAVSVSPVHVELFEAAAEDLVDELLALPATDPRRLRIFVCAGTDDACTRQILAGFARRAFRRPVTDAEVGRLTALAARARTQTGRPEDGLRAALRAVLLSPHFLFRVERDGAAASTLPRALSDHELAVRLSYFFWSTMPDDELARAADAGRLTKDATELDRQITRLLASPRADALAKNFAGQWLFTRSIEQFEPERTVYKTYDERLRAGMRAETERFWSALVQESHPIERLLTADFTFVNDRLSRHYALPAVAGADLQRASVAATPRRGLLGQGSFLLVTSQPERTSPVKRGAWVLEQLMCAPPPPPPPDVEALTPPKAGDGTTLRQRLERHRQSPECAACHRLIDPIGLGLENFDGIGAYRATDNGKPIDATGELPDGSRFSGPAELAALLARDPRFLACAAEQVLTYGVGRAFEGAADHAYVEEIVRRARAAGGTWAALLRATALGEAFRMRRPESP